MLSHETISKYVVLMCMCTVLLFIGGCTWNTIKSQEEAGAVNLTVTLVAPWEDYIAALEPKFDLSAEQALSKVIPRTALLEEKILDALGFSARIGFPQTSETSTKTSKQTDGAMTSSEERVVKKEAGKVPEATPQAPGGNKSVKELEGIPDSEKKISKDPILEYTAATSLYQEVQLLNRYVRDAALRHKKRPYVVRLQIGVIPFQRYLGYDIYTKLGFFPKVYAEDRLQGTPVGTTEPEKPQRHSLQSPQSQCEDGHPDQFEHANKEDYPAYVVPLLVTDNLEGALTSRTSDAIRQLALAISFMISGVGANVGGEKLREDLKTEVFTDVNSLLTVGRLTDNTLSIRFGAVRQGEKYSIIPRTHNVTLLLMVDEEFIRAVNPSIRREVRVVARTAMRSVNDGKLLPQQSREDRFQHVQEAVSAYVELDKRTSEALEKVRNAKCKSSDREDKGKCISCSESLLRAVWKNDFPEFLEKLKEAEIVEYVGRYPRDLWMDIVDTLEKSHISGARFELPNQQHPQLPKDQAILLVDDGKTQMRTALMGGSRLGSNQIKSTLHLYLQNGKTVDLAGTVSPGSEGTDPVLVFPSPVALGIGKLKTSQVATLDLMQEPHGRWDSGEVSVIGTQSYTNITYKLTEEIMKPVFAIRKTFDIIKPNAAGEGSVKIFVESDKDDNNQRLANKVELGVIGAEIVDVQFEDKSRKKVPHAFELGKITLTEDGTLELKLRNLDKSKRVLIKALAKDSNGKPFGEDHPDVFFDVVN